MAGFRQHKKPIHLGDDNPWSAEHRLYPTLMAVIVGIVALIVVIVQFRGQKPSAPKPKGVNVMNYTAPAVQTPAPAQPLHLAVSEPKDILPSNPDDQPLSQAPSARLLGRKERTLEEETDRIRQALERGRQHCLKNRIIVEAHFALGTNQWSVRSANALGSRSPASSATLRLWTNSPWPNKEPEGNWQFLTFCSTEGENTGPMLVFFPGGDTQGGEIQLGWLDGPRQILHIDETSQITSRFAKTANLEATK